MNSHRYAKQFVHEDWDGASSGPREDREAPSSREEAAPESASEGDAAALYLDAPPAVAPRPHSATPRRLRVKQFAETRLEHLSEELSKLADQIRYYHPVIAEALDDAWDATEEAIAMLSDDEAWVAGRQ